MVCTEFPMDSALFIKYTSHLDDLLLSSQSQGVVKASIEVVISLACDIPHRMHPDEPAAIEIATDVMDILAGVLSGYDIPPDIVKCADDSRGPSDLLQSLIQLWELWREVPGHGRLFGNAIMKVFGVLAQSIENKQVK